MFTIKKAILFFILATTVFLTGCKEPEKGVVVILVVDNTEAAVDGATVTILNEQNQIISSGTSMGPYVYCQPSLIQETIHISANSPDDLYHAEHTVSIAPGEHKQLTLMLN